MAGDTLSQLCDTCSTYLASAMVQTHAYAHTLMHRTMMCTCRPTGLCCLVELHVVLSWKPQLPGYTGAYLSSHSCFPAPLMNYA